MSFSAFESAINEACARKRVAGAAVGTVFQTSHGLQRYHYAFGRESVAPDASDMKMDSVMWMASCTKLVCAISALQLVEKRLLALDEPLNHILPEYAPPIPLASLSPAGELVMSTTDEPLTLRRLLSHSSGFSYECDGNEVATWRKALPETSSLHPSRLHKQGKEVTVDYKIPLIFSPGTLGRWSYGPSIDWVGKVVERVNPEGLTLGKYMAKNIFEPLRMTSTTFRPLRDPKLAGRLFPFCLRLDNGNLGIDPMENYPHIEPLDELGGAGLYSTAGDYIKVLESLLLDDGKLLLSETVDELLQPQLFECPKLQTVLAQCNDGIALKFETEYEGTDKVRWSYSLCGLTALNGVPGKCEEGTNLWSGVANTYWWVDRKAGTAGFYGNQIWPWADPVSERLNAEFQKAAYAAASS